MKRQTLLLATLIVLALACVSTAQKDRKKPKKKTPAPFKWVNQFPEGKYPGLRHGVFHSEANNADVGYCIYLPPRYDDPQNAQQRYPVVYYLHGGRPGSETKSIFLTPTIDRAIRSGQVPPMIYVFVNGGAVSHYDYPKLHSLGESAFKELIPHIDKTYRTIASRAGRAVEGFSQGGRGAARYMFKFPELFCAAAPMGGGHQHEKRISQSNGDEGAYQFEPGNNTYDLARKYAAAGAKPPLRILVMFGDKDFNYEANLDFLEHLKKLNIPFEHKVVPGVPHSAKLVYEKEGLRAMKFHAENFAAKP